MKKIILGIFVILVNSIFANCLTFINSANKTAKYLKVIKLVNITQKDLHHGTKSDNINALLFRAEKEGRINFLNQPRYAYIFQNLNNGDKALLNCLKYPTCNIEEYVDILGKSSLHKQVIINNPSLNLAQSNHIVGSINEALMNKYFRSTGWVKIEGEVGRNGIDGLFIKRNKDNQIIDLLICESKYNTSGLQHTKNGQQMTKQWILKKINDLQKHYPNNKDYVIIGKLVENDNYRSLLWNLKADNNILNISLKKLHDKNGKIILKELTGSKKMKINFKSNQTIDIKNPKNSFHKEISSWYREEIQSIKPK
jgi:hypothetical protein